VYGVPLALLVGWRGEPGGRDEPQHVTQGRVTLPLLDAMGIPALVLAQDEAAAAAQLDECFAYLRAKSAPFALVVQKDTFAPYTRKTADAETEAALMSREEAIEIVLAAAPENAFFFSTTGMASRELYELRERRGEGHGRDFLTVGSMGHCLSIALGAALARPERQIFCLDGDGALLMHMGGLAAAGVLKPPRLMHIVLNNGAHDSVGGQPTIARQVDLRACARAAGYAQVFRAQTPEELRGAVEAAVSGGPAFIEAVVRKGARPDLGRPQTTPRENKAAFMAAFQRQTEES